MKLIIPLLYVLSIFVLITFGFSLGRITEVAQYSDADLTAAANVGSSAGAGLDFWDVAFDKDLSDVVVKHRGEDRVVTFKIKASDHFLYTVQGIVGPTGVIKGELKVLDSEYQQPPSF